VVADASFVEAGTAVTVVLQEGLRIVVRPQPAAGTPETQG
jgi:membrane-bound ClpP family serine protease